MESPPRADPLSGSDPDRADLSRMKWALSSSSVCFSITSGKPPTLNVQLPCVKGHTHSMGGRFLQSEKSGKRAGGGKLLLVKQLVSMNLVIVYKMYLSHLTRCEEQKKTVIPYLTPPHFLVPFRPDLAVQW